MPYIEQDQRQDLNWYAETPGELNYYITMVCNDYVEQNGFVLNYNVINTIIGALECAKQEFYRRVAIPYEEEKKEENGDVYPD